MIHVTKPACGMILYVMSIQMPSIAQNMVDMIFQQNLALINACMISKSVKRIDETQIAANISTMAAMIAGMIQLELFALKWHDTVF